MDSLKALGLIIRKLRKERNWTIDQLAKRIKKSKTYISLIENSERRLNTSLIGDFSKAFGIPPAHLILEAYAYTLEKASRRGKGKGPAGMVHGEELIRELKSVVDKHVLHGVAQVVEIRRIPIVSSTAAGEPVYFEDSFPLGHADEWVECPQEVDDPNAFALRVRGDSMEERFYEGDIVIVCPNWKVKEHRPVVAKVKDGEITCKIFNKQKDSIILSSVNLRYPPQVYTAENVQWIYPVARLISTVY
ncbi:MAG: helix-turn-helix domain-containing protein [Planctomycetota bacterium]|jgi:SOS-response transcriptional repressor LexA